MVVAGKDYSVYENDPDMIVDWNLIEEVQLHTTEPPACPICLYPPTVAKVSLRHSFQGIDAVWAMTMLGTDCTVAGLPLL